MAKNEIGTVAIVNRGNYSETVQYYTLNMVKYNGGLYIATKDMKGVTPTSSDWVNASNGIKGISEVVSGINHTYTISFTDNTTYSFTIKDGYTPIKGTDYYTTEDIASLNIPTKTSDITNDSHFGVTNANNNFSTAQTINGTLTVNGDIVQNGQSYEVETETIKTKDDYIVLRNGAVGGLATNQYTGLEAVKYDGTNNGVLAFDNTGTARVGDKGSEQPLATRKESNLMTNGKLVKWNSSTLQLETDDNNEVIKSLILTSKPISSTVGYLGQQAVVNEDIYECVKISNGVYTWKLLTDKKVLSQAEYEALTTKDSEVFYCIEEA